MKELIAILRKHVNEIVLLILLILTGIFCINTLIANRNLRKINDNNVVALTDSVQFYKSKSGDLVAEKTLLLGDIRTLRLANKELADEIEDMKLHNPQQVVYIETEVINEVHDTTWIIQPNDSLVIKEFDFSNKWRILSGNIKLQNENLSLNIDNDKVFVNYTLAIKDNKVYVKSDNPYITYGDIQGLTLPKQRKNFSIGIGPTISYGYDFQHKTFAPIVGVSLGLYYNLIQF